MKIILASKSPRRKELLHGLFPDFSIITRDVDESLPKGTSPRDGVGILAIRKGEAVAAENPEALVISADTLVEKGGRALGKPRNEDEAMRMLKELSDSSHNVHTGVAVHYRGEVFFGTDSTEVVFRPISDREIIDYIKTGEPMDKAGSYGIQGRGGVFVLEYKGNYDTVVGLPLSLTKRLAANAAGELLPLEDKCEN